MSNQTTYDFNPCLGVNPGERHPSAQIGSPKYDDKGREYYETVYGGDARQYTGQVRNPQSRNW